MALPVLNEVPQYELVIPSTEQKAKFRPFLVKEQKVLLIAYESRDPKQIMDATMNCISSCVEGLDVSKLATFDVDYIFTQIRSKSVGESTDVISKCTSCEHENEIKIDLSEIKLNDINRDYVVPITDAVNIKMKYPTYHDIITNDEILSENALNTERLFSSIKICLDSVMTDEENISLKDESPEEIERFMNSLTNEQFDRITRFVDGIPKLKYEKDYKCEKCQSNNTIKVEGLQDFFS